MIPDERAEWLEWRKGGLGASDVPQILLGPDERPRWMSPWRVWASKRGIAPDESDNKAVAEGNRLERVIAEWYCGSLNNHGVFAPAFALSDEDVKGEASAAYPWLRATPDFWLHRFERIPGGPPEPVQVRRGLECKHVYHPLTAEHWAGELPPLHVQYQVNAQMLVFGRSEWHVAAFLRPTVEFRGYVLQRDDAICDRILTEGKAWWDRHIVGDEEPRIGWDESCREALTRWYDATEETVREASPLEARLMAAVEAHRDAAKLEADHKAEASNALRQAIGHGYGLQSETHRATWAANKSGGRTLRVSRRRNPAATKE